MDIVAESSSLVLQFEVVLSAPILLSGLHQVLEVAYR